MCFDNAERFSLLLNDLEGSMKPHPGKYPPENCLGIFSPIKIPTMNTAPEKTSLVETASVIIADYT